MEKIGSDAGYPSSSEQCGRFIYINRILCRTETDDGSFRPSDVFGSGESHGWRFRPYNGISHVEKAPVSSGERGGEGNCDAESVAGFACAQYIRQLIGMPSIAPVTPNPSQLENPPTDRSSPSPNATEGGRPPMSSTIKLVSLDPLNKSEELSTSSNMSGVIDCPIVNMFGVLSGGVLVGCTTAKRDAPIGSPSPHVLSAGEFVDFSDTTIVSACSAQTSSNPKETRNPRKNESPQPSTRQFINEVLYRCRSTDRIAAEGLLSLHSSIEPFSGDGIKSQCTPTLPYPVRPHVRSYVYRDLGSLLSKIDTAAHRKQLSKRLEAKKSALSAQKRAQATVWNRFEQRIPAGVDVDAKLAADLENFRLRCSLSAPQSLYQPLTIPFPFQLNGLKLAVNSNSVVDKLRTTPQSDLVSYFQPASLSARRESFGVYSGSINQAWRQKQDSRDTMTKHQTFEKRLTSSLKCVRDLHTLPTPEVAQDGNEEDEEDDAAIAAFLRTTKSRFENVETWNLWKAFRKYYDNVGVLCAIANKAGPSQGGSPFTYIVPGALRGAGFKGYVDHFALTASPPSLPEEPPSQNVNGTVTGWTEKQRIIADSWHYLLLAQPLALKERIEHVVESCRAIKK